MIECNVNNIKKYYGADLIFENISFDIKTNERIGLIGPNGSGKTTIMKIIIGLEHVQEGNVSFRKGSKVGYLDQIPLFDDHTRVIEILKEAFKDVFLLKEKLDDCATKLGSSSGTELEIALKEYTNLSMQYEQLDGYLTETKISKVCGGLKISNEMQDMTFNLLSGGEKTRVMLAKILLEQPSILMLDEPSNHLDLESIEWLEGYLKDYKGSVLIVSHDRYFLDNVCKKIIELSTYKAYVYHGNYSYYVIEKERRFLLEMKIYQTQERKIKRMEDQIERYRIWGRMRDSDKMFKRAKELERRLEKIERLDKPIKDNPKMKITKIQTSRSGKRVLEAKDISLGFDDLSLLKKANISLYYQDRLAILGKNGSGKTTLLRYLLGDIHKEEPYHKWGAKLNIGYLAQEVKFEQEDLSVLDYFMNEHQVNQNEARSELAKALFIRDDVYKHIKNLSGGEKSKLKLCSLNYNKVNLMILDEPTNHLDIDSREILEELLTEFKGTILFVSHDRYFIKKIANRITEISNQSLLFYEGGYDYYRYVKKREEVSIDSTKEKPPIKQKTSIPKNYKKEIAKVEKELSDIDSEISKHVYDSEKLTKLYEQKEKLEEQYLELLEKDL